MKNLQVWQNILIIGLTALGVGQFGLTTHAAGQYQAKWIDQLEGMSVKQGDSVAVWVDVQNTGTATWSNSGANAVKIATIKPRDRMSKFYHSSWLSSNRVAVTIKEQIAPGEVGRFAFTVTAGGAPGKYREYFGLVAEGIAWLDPFYFYIEINIQPAVYTVSWVNQSDSPTMTPGEETVVWIDLKNTGNTAWLNTGDTAVKLGTARSLDRVSAFASSTWLSPNRAAVADKLIQPGETGRFTFTIKAPEQVGTYKEYFRLVVEGVAWMNDLGIYWEIIVNEELVIGKPITVGLSSTTSPMVLISDKGMVVRRGSDKGMVVRIDANKSATVTARNGGYIINISGQVYDVSDWVKFIPLRNSIITVSNEKISSTYNRFRGLLIIRRSALSNNVWMVNELELEDYLKGLAEVPDSWPIEARKAQVVAARTFAVRRIQNPRADIFDLYDDTRDQVYYGHVYETNRPGIAEVVMTTTGMIIKYGSDPITAYYFSDSGGATENVENAWNNGNPNLAIPYLKGVTDPYAKPITWEATLSQAYLREIFGKTLEKVGAFSETVTDLIVESRYPSGRLQTLAIVTSTGKRTSVSTATFEALVDTGYVKSTNFTVEKSGAANAPTFVLRGVGWGHGVGMPQWSAYNMAQAGQTFEQILKYFYTGVTIANS